MAGAVFGEVQVSLFVAGAAFGEIWNDSRSAKCCIFQYKMLAVGVKSNLGCVGTCDCADQTISFAETKTISTSAISRFVLGNHHEMYDEVVT